MNADSVFRRRYPTVEEKVAAFVGALEESLPELCTENGWDDFVEGVASMPRYSANNVRLIRLQMPAATEVATFKEWRERGRAPKDDAVGIAILQQAKVKVPLTEADGTPLLDAKGQQLFDERATGDTKVGTVFDISQTVGPRSSPPAVPDAQAFRSAFSAYTDVSDPEAAVEDVARMRLDVLGGDDTNIEAEAHAVAVVLARRWGLTEPMPPRWVDRSPAAVRASSVRVSRVVTRLLGTPLFP
ncbi:ArdC-like ssDNA-binding domain-containing protein [Curtobacterium sp. MCBD17_040]|uniref:ArdC-like ssDNA-binding domain-containing protein n=1 Tax=Curtobacterium sp. MCBD17_040 TaxID=2175674 RepID=UPI000DA9B29E|nr:ArdC-like ssDNA-binding domain-containing protein [Curtobacterium sp. MCBD17_040]WIB65673.1 ArdC-like ssDNA-binding domain-containing protein [Curtobacterium sp. MCBD17_040]